MVDNALYTNVSGAKEYLRKSYFMANNLANINTVGFHADFGTLVSNPSKQHGMQTRILPGAGKSYTDHRSGPVYYTGRELDVAVDGAGFIAVQNKLGQKGYTRAGNFEITNQGLLITKSGDLVLGEEGVITIPPATKIRIDNKGVVTAHVKGENQIAIATVGRIKLVNPDIKAISKGKDGLFYGVGEGNINASQDVKLVPESLEGSNVEAISSLVKLVELSRQFDFQTKLMNNIDENATRANSLMAFE